MADQLKVSPEHLFASAAEVDGHAEDYFVDHAASDNRIGDAEPGLAGLSAEAITAKAARWRETTSALGTRIAGHAESLRTAGSGFADMEQRHAEAMRRLRPGPA